MSYRNLLLSAALVASVSAATIGCHHHDHKMTKTEKAAMPMGPSLYTRLGGEPAITAVVNDFIPRALNDKAVDFTRANTPGATPWKPTDAEVATFKKHLIQFVCVAAGGPQKYEGQDMKTSHKGMKITQAQFNALAGDLAASLDALKVPAQEKGELLSAVAGTAKDIVEIQ